MNVQIGAGPEYSEDLLEIPAQTLQRVLHTSKVLCATWISQLLIWQLSLGALLCSLNGTSKGYCGLNPVPNCSVELGTLLHIIPWIWGTLTNSSVSFVGLSFVLRFRTLFSLEASRLLEQWVNWFLCTLGAHSSFVDFSFGCFHGESGLNYESVLAIEHWVEKTV